MCVTDRHDITLAVKVAFNPNTTNQPTNASYTRFETDAVGAGLLRHLENWNAYGTLIILVLVFGHS